MKKIFLLTVITTLIAVGCQKTPTQNNPIAPSSSNTNTSSPAAVINPKLSIPIADGLARITKKPFGIYITPQNSPVTPEKFKGYHTGTDFETFESEKDTEVEIFAACGGKLLLKKSATGYGGVAVQSCVIDSQNVTVLYGHLKLSSISKMVGDSLKAGEKLAILGKGYSSETDGERKHLHFSIHKGTSIILLGYTQNKTDLSNWLNSEDYFK
ncbi:MAG: M23 family metallopeptidase [Candidatus Doudnabacteria bacterium]|jgi:murein DD-endopeptidase MepM/ murein hydrolase activator NlpD